MDTYTVLYCDESVMVLESPLGFVCEADDTDHAEEQCLNAYPECDIVWVVKTNDIQEALLDYYY